MNWYTSSSSFTVESIDGIGIEIWEWGCWVWFLIYDIMSSNIYDNCAQMNGSIKTVIDNIKSIVTHTLRHYIGIIDMWHVIKQ